MPFLTPLSSSDLADIRANGYSANQYLLIDDSAIVFRAEVATTSTSASIAQIEYTNVTIGEEADILPDFTVYISDTAGAYKQSNIILRVRPDDAGQVASGLLLNVGWSSARVVAGQIITIVKDVRPAGKLPRDTFYDYMLDTPPLPMITGLQSVYAGIVDSEGELEIALSPTGVAVASGATITGWQWLPDGGTFAAGGATTKDVTLKFDATGVYMPRVIATDSNGNTNYFTFRVFVVGAGFSSIVNLSYEGVTINCQRDIGFTASLTSFEGAEDVADYSFCAVWLPDGLAQSSDIVFCGRFRSVTDASVITPPNFTQSSARYVVEGALATLSAQNSYSVGYVHVTDTPTRFNEIVNLTAWRALSAYICQMTTIANIHSFSFDDYTNTFRRNTYPFQESDLLDTVQTVAERIIRGVESAPTGEIRIAKNGVVATDTDRDALDVVATLTASDIAAPQSGGELYAISNDYLSTVGLLRLGCVNVVGTEEVVYRASAPAVVPVNSQRIIEEDGHVLDTALSAGAAFAEAGRRVADLFASSSKVTRMTVSLVDGFKMLIPAFSQWYQFDFVGGRWVLDEIDYRYESATGRTPLPRATFIRETQGGDFQTLVEVNAETDEPLAAPPMPVLNPYPAFPPFPDVFGGANNIDNQQPYSSQDVEIVTQPEDIATEGGASGASYRLGVEAGVAWGDNEIYRVTGIGGQVNPTYEAFTPSDVRGTLKDFKLDPYGNGALAVSHDDTNSRIHRTISFTNTVFVPRNRFGDKIEMIRYGGKPDSVYMQGEFDTSLWEIDYNFRTNDQDWERIRNVIGGAGHVASEGWRFNHGFGQIGQSIGIELTEGVSFGDFQLVGGLLTYTATPGSFGERSWGLEFNNSRDTSLSLGTPRVRWPLIPTTDQTRDENSVGESTSSSLANWIIFKVSTSGAGITATIHRLRIFGTGVNPLTGATGVGEAVGTIYSINKGVTFQELRQTGSSEVRGIDVSAAADSTRVFASDDTRIRVADDGEAYANDSGGDAGAAVCVRALGDDEYLYATVTKLYASSGGVDTDITPNDGTHDGTPVSANCIHTPVLDGDVILYLSDYDGTTKLAYTVDGGDNWSFNTQVTNDAKYIRCKSFKDDVTAVWIADDTTLWYTLWDRSGALTLTQYFAPVPLIGFEPYGVI